MGEKPLEFMIILSSFAITKCLVMINHSPNVIGEFVIN
ncbi:hypothetical protein BVRB_5g122470 [Beta vulgaris subsp. vulgaris]|nr:hypothetical protein BVRB_5g122470 [Beta vulgaris subsp. vulgaris]